MSAKVVEANAKIHSLAMAVAVSRVLKSSLPTIDATRLCGAFFNTLMTDDCLARGQLGLIW